LPFLSPASLVTVAIAHVVTIALVTTLVAITLIAVAIA
jgi:hypothetical protein